MKSLPEVLVCMTTGRSLDRLGPFEFTPSYISGADTGLREARDCWGLFIYWNWYRIERKIDSLSEADPFRIIFFIMVDNKEDGIGSDTINCTHGPFELPQRRRASTLLILARRATLASRK
jgi:hypothetical protein